MSLALEVLGFVLCADYAQVYVLVVVVLFGVGSPGVAVADYASLVEPQIPELHHLG